MRLGIRGKLLAVSVFVIVAGLLGAQSYISSALDRDVEQRERMEMSERASMLRAALMQSQSFDATAGARFVHDQSDATHSRVTLIAPDGRAARACRTPRATFPDVRAPRLSHVRSRELRGVRASRLPHVTKLQLPASLDCNFVTCGGPHASDSTVSHSTGAVGSHAAPRVVAWRRLTRSAGTAARKRDASRERASARARVAARRPGL